jgi:ubiquitin-conjugating enzyme E2 variant
LAAGYTKGHRAYELGGMALAIIFATFLSYKLAHSAPSGWWAPLAVFTGILAADFTSGFFHWGFDTWGQVDTPVLGKLAIRTFREHHVDQKAITRHDFVETNGHNFALTVISSSFGILYLYTYDGLLGTFLGMSCLSTTLFVAFTSQIHKYAHMDKPPKAVELLQRARLILAPEHHAQHHTAPYDRSYCITVGWLNGPLRAVRFFETLEKIISWVTGAIPREDDIGKAAAIELEHAREAEVEEATDPVKTEA